MEWQLFCVGGNGKEVEFLKVFWGYCFWFCSFCFAGCMVVGIFRLSDERDEGKIGVMKTKEGAVEM